MPTYTNRVYDAVASSFVRWDTAVPDSVGSNYPGPDSFGNTFDFVTEGVKPTSSGGSSVSPDSLPGRFTISGQGTSLQVNLQPTTDYVVIPAPTAVDVLRIVGSEGGSSLIVRNESGSAATLTVFFTDQFGNESTLSSQSLSAGQTRTYFGGEVFLFFGLKSVDGGIGIRFTGGDVSGISARSTWLDTVGIERQDTEITTSPVSILPAPATGESIVVVGVDEVREFTGIVLLNYDTANTPDITVAISDGVGTVPVDPDTSPFPADEGRELLVDGGEGTIVLLSGWTLTAVADVVGTEPVYTYAFFSRTQEP